MNTKMKQELISDVLTGLVVAATFGAVMPVEAFAQLSTATGQFQTQVGVPFTTVVSMICYGIGAVLTVAGIAGAKKHADAPAQNALGPVLGRLGAGAAFLAAPTLIGMVSQTGTLALNAGTSHFATVNW